MRNHLMLIGFVAGFVAGYGSSRARGDKTEWVSGPYLMLDERLIAEQDGVRREVGHPSRLPDPIVTGYEDGCFQPWVSVVRDSQSRRFRMWYNVPATPGNMNQSHLAYLESEDGIHWLRPPRVLETPPIQYGASVLDEGLAYPDAQRRFKLAWWYQGGLRVAASPDGLAWSPLADGVVLPTNHDITAIDWDPIRRRYMALLSMQPARGPYKGLRMPHESTSTDLVTWRQPWQIVQPDANAAIEKGETQFYGMSAVLARGDLLIGLVKVLRDDLNGEPNKTAAELHDDSKRPFAGIGYTVFAWSHDGEHWNRETEPFLERNGQAGTWDRAFVWADDQLVVGDFTYIYYGGYRWGHKAERLTERQLGFAQMPRDRYVGFTAGEHAGRLVTRDAVLRAAQMTVNARIQPSAGELRVRIVDEHGQPYAGFDWDDGSLIKGDRVAHPVAWKGENNTLKDKPVRFEFRFRGATIYAFELNS